ncbi:twin-arginine translocase TatA/TatE family subunit [Sphingomicrobium clamense]|uniref:Sec-independent protein translocase protein TatA n=1 Tax=Sphingomicrobium clamense TaxID=2851013 RepID=A0ABS6V4D4_9SPHN|nr:twin-arginine translocase TatA/TatE family subunit [Sphingomicrobium sp. B8]MBW0144419.1 twin-arginine translocase TatA/TatE family subunit [Sphingomicrobium sp. B8]
MGNIGLPGILLIALIILLLFGRNRFSNMMGDLAKGVKNFKKGMADEEAERPAEPRQLPREDTVDVEARRDTTRDETR